MRFPLLLLSGAVGLVLLIAVSNVAGLQMASGVGRSQEYALRAALGADGRRIVRLVCVESLMLAAGGGALGVALASLGLGLIRMLGPQHLPRIDDLRLDTGVLAFAMSASIGASFVAAVLPALAASRADLQLALADGSRSTTSGYRIGGVRDRIVVAEIALALVLTIGSGLLLRSFERLGNNQLGFDPEDRLAVQVWAYDDEHRSKLEYFQRGIEEIRGVPGVEAVGLTTDLPLADEQSILSAGRTTAVTIEGDPANTRQGEPRVRLIAIDSGYAKAMGARRAAGRGFEAADRSETRPVAMVNEAFVRRFLGARDPIGRRLTLLRETDTVREVVGVLGDMRPRGFESEPEPEVYVPLSQAPSNGLTFVIKTAGHPATLAPAVREALWRADASQAIWANRPMTELLSDWIRQRRFNTVLLAGFAGLALALAAIGTYGLISFSVQQRVNELGIRRALGGTSSAILTMVLRRALMLALAGTALGLVGSMAMARLLRGMLFGIDPFDPVTFVGLSVLVLGVAILAAVLPAWRAVHIDPMAALRAE